MSARERPILFSAPMVRAILDGRKTQTRRVVKLPHQNPLGAWEPTTCGDGADRRGRRHAPCPGIWHTRAGDSIAAPWTVGDRLWVKETWRPRAASGPYDPAGLGAWDIEVTYAADGTKRIIYDGEFGEREWNMPKAAARGNVTPLFMPRWASRITLEVTGVRVERLQSISEADAEAEGVDRIRAKVPMHRDAFHLLWNEINGDGAWKANPWVWVVEFRRVEAPTHGD